MNDNRTCESDLFLGHGMRMIPIGSVLSHREFDRQCFSCFDWKSSQSGNPVVLIRDQYPVPVNRSCHLHLIVHPDECRISFLQLDGWAWNLTIYGNRMAGFACIIYGSILYV